MDAFNCARSKGKDQLPPLPRGHVRSLKSALTCGIASGTNETKPTRSSNTPKMYDPFNYDSASMTRDLFKGFIIRRRDSLTNRECSFLESLVEDAGEDDLNNAMMVLSDTDLFFHPNERMLDRSASRLLGRDDSDRSFPFIEVGERRDEWCSIVGASTSSSHLGANKENHLIKRAEDTEELSVEIIASEDGAIILQDLENPVEQKPTKAKLGSDFESPTVTMNKKGFITPTGRKQRAISAPMSLPANLGTSHRIARVLERRESSVHQGMWKAHKQGLSLTPQTSFQCRHTSRSRGKSPSVRRPTSTSRVRSNLMQRNDLGSLHHAHHFNSSAAFMISDSCSDADSFGVVRQDYVDHLRDSMSTINTNELYDASTSSIPGLDLATPMHGSNSSALPYYTSRESPSRRGSLTLGDSQSSFPFLHHGQSLGDSITSFPSLHPSHPLRQTSNGSIPSIPSSRPLIRGLSHVSSASESSITLNSLHNGYSFERGTSNSSVGSTASFRYQVPMRPLRNPSPVKTLRNPSPLSRPAPVQRRAVSDNSALRVPASRPRVYARAGSIACKFLFYLN